MTLTQCRRVENYLTGVCIISQPQSLCLHTHKVHVWSHCMAKYRRGDLASHFHSAPCHVFESVFYDTPPSYTASICVKMLLKNANVVLIGSPELGERIHTHMIAKNAKERPIKPQSPRLFGLKKGAFELNRAMTSSLIITSSFGRSIQ